MKQKQPYLIWGLGIHSNYFLKFICILCFLSCWVWSNKIFDKADQWLNQKFPTQKVKVEWQSYAFSDSVKHSIQNQTHQLFYFKNKVFIATFSVDQERYLAIIDNVMGKALPITFLSLFDNHSNLLSNHILAYREAYGGGVQSEKWLSQFKNKKQIHEFEVGVKVHAISGATISVKSVTKGILKSTLLAQFIQSKR